MTERNNQFQLKPLPLKLGEQVIAKTREFLAWLEQSGSTTHPHVRVIYNSTSLLLPGLIGEVEAQKVQAAGGGEDEMDAWQRNGLVPGQIERAGSEKPVS